MTGVEITPAKFKKLGMALPTTEMPNFGAMSQLCLRPCIPAELVSSRYHMQPDVPRRRNTWRLRPTKRDPHRRRTLLRSAPLCRGRSGDLRFLAAAILRIRLSDLGPHMGRCNIVTAASAMPEDFTGVSGVMLIYLLNERNQLG